MTADSWVGETVVGECRRCGHKAEVVPEPIARGRKGHCTSCGYQVKWDREKWADAPVTLV
jgi:ribosomal protein L37E